MFLYFHVIQAISNPGEDFQEKARDAVFPLVQQLRRYHDFSLEIGKKLKVSQ